jgi:lipooligosaccharide transport system ATP-binding protein
LLHDGVTKPRVVSSPAIKATNLTKNFGDLVAVNGVSLEVPRGICFGLLGPNGAGKTTMIRMMQASSPLTGGSLEVLGIDVTSKGRDVRSRIGVIPQEDNLDPDFSAEYNLVVYARYFGLTKKQALEKATLLLEDVGLTEKAKEKIPNLSGGMKRRLIVARGLMNDPELLILDEPTTGLDPQARHRVWDQIRNYRRSGRTILLTTHYMDEAELLCDDLAIIDAGQVLVRGPPRTLIHDTVGNEAIEFVASLFDGGDEALDRIESRALELGLKTSRIADRIIAYGEKISQLASEFESDDEVNDVITRRATLEDVFLQLTGRQLRE